MKGVLLVNLGSPDSTDPQDVKKYLDEFLMDKYVIDYPYLFRALLVRGIILRNRPKESAHAYATIWTDEGSPLITISKKFHKKVETLSNVPVSLAMRYGNPSIETGLKELHDQGVDDVLLFPLYPQYAMASTLTIEKLAEKIQKSKFPNMKLTNVPAFYNKEDYIQNLSDSIKEQIEGFEFDKLVFSYHGIPERHVRKTDPTKKHKKFTTDVMCCSPNSEEGQTCYRTQCYETTRLVAEKLGLKVNQYYSTFQSRLANDKWLEPYTDVVLNEYPAKGVKKIAVCTPAFVADCLETLEEIGIRADEDFKANGGESFKAITCLNDRDDWSQTVAKWINSWEKTGNMFVK